MGIFDKLLGSGGEKKLTLNEQDAFMAVSIMVAYADGFMGDEEARAVVMALGRMKLFRGYDYDLNVYRVYNIIKHHGEEAVIEAAKNALSAEMRETAFAFAVDIALADGHLDKEERGPLTKLYKGLGIPDPLVTKIVEVTQIRNRG